MKEKISVIIPIYNVEDYLEQCVESILNQTYTNLEIILVNDGSTDSSGEICDRYKNIDKRIKVIHKENGGLSDARNYGIEASTGDYIAFLDSDDWADKNLYMTLYKNIKKNHADISICNFKKYYSDKDIEKQELNEVKCYSNIEALERLYCNDAVIMVVAWNKLYKRKVIGDLRFPVGKIHEDEYLTPMIIYNANKISYINNELIYYRQRENSIMNRRFNIKRLDYLYVLESRMKFFKENMLDELYEKNVCTYLEKVMEFYFLIKNSEIENKKSIMKKLKNKLSNLNKNLDINLPKNLKTEILLFNIYPGFYYIKKWLDIKKELMIKFK